MAKKIKSEDSPETEILFLENELKLALATKAALQAELDKITLERNRLQYELSQMHKAYDILRNSLAV
jgi:hypothetical protein